jgi:hypothetical protein
MRNKCGLLGHWPSGESACPRLLRLLGSFLVLAGVLPRIAPAELIAERITAQNVHAARVGGPDADAGIDDWRLSNGTICAAISDPSHESPLAPAGGVLIDLGVCGAQNDQWTVLQPMLNLSQGNVVPVHEVEATTTEDRAWIRTRALFSGIEIRTTYTLERATPEALDLYTRARRIDGGDDFFAVGSVLLHPGGQSRPFSLQLNDLTASRGFAYPASNHRSLRSLLSALSAADLHVLVGADGLPGVSYGIQRLDARLERDGRPPRALGSFAVTGGHFTALNTLTRPFWIGRGDRPPGLLQMAQLPFMDLEAGEVLEMHSRIWVGDRADVASITDRIWASQPRVSGRVDDPRARIHVRRIEGAPISQVRPDADGRFSLRLPPGRYVAEARSDAGRQAQVPFEVANGAARGILPLLELGSPAEVELPGDFVGRLVFLPDEGSGAIRFGDDQLGFRVGDTRVPGGLEAPFVNLARSPFDPARVALPPGGYRVLALRGPEYALTQTRLKIRPGQSTKLSLESVERIRPTPGWIAADLHVHSARSFDSSLPQARQIAAFVASGAEILVATEHDRIVDPRPAIEAAGATGRLRSITGVEMTSTFEGGDVPHSSGHLNAFPLAESPLAFRGGAPNLEGRRVRDALADLRRSAGAPFVQLNHPRPIDPDDEGDAYFMHLGVAGEPFDPTRPLDRAPNRALIERSSTHGLRDLDFDGLELLNRPSLSRYRRVRADWLSLLLQGERRIATASSDSHRQGEIVGLPRTYVAVVDDRLERFDEIAFVEALRAGRAYGTTGPLLQLRLGEAGIGDLHGGDHGVLELRVEAADWVPLSEWRAYVNGSLVHRAPIHAGDVVGLPLHFSSDAFVTVEVEGPAEGVYADALPGFVPFAFTNPIFVDQDGNGRFDAPGLPDPAPSTLARPEARDR